MQTSDIDTFPRAHGSEQQGDHGKELGQTVDTGSTALGGLATDSNALAKSVDDTTPEPKDDEQSQSQRSSHSRQRDSTAPSRAVANSLHSGLSISEHVSLLVEELRIDEELANTDNMPLPEPDTEMTENIPEVDDEDEEPTGSVYAASQYPAILALYRTEGFEGATINSSSRSLYEEELDYVTENGRRYCGDYIFPNDDVEQDRLRIMHQVFLNIPELASFTSVPLKDPDHILDIGTGTGEWAIGIAELFPSCEVVGVDISAIQPTAVPYNVFFEVDDCEIEWMFPQNSVDLVHLRDMAGAFADWDFIFREALGCLKPGGYIECLDFHDRTGQTHNFLDAFPEDAQIHEFARAIDEASILAGRRRGTHHLEAERLERIGFVDVEISEHALPLNAQEDSVMWLVVCLCTVEAGSLRLLTKYLGWDPKRVWKMCDKVCHEILQKARDRTAPPNSLNISLRVLKARKPMAEEQAELNSGKNKNTDLLTVDSANNGLAPGDGYSGDESTIGV